MFFGQRLNPLVTAVAMAIGGAAAVSSAVIWGPEKLSHGLLYSFGALGGALTGMLPGGLLTLCKEDIGLLVAGGGAIAGGIVAGASREFFKSTVADTMGPVASGIGAAAVWGLTTYYAMTRAERNAHTPAATSNTNTVLTITNPLYAHPVTQQAMHVAVDS